MAFHKDFPDTPYAILDPAIRWFENRAGVIELLESEIRAWLAAGSA